MPEKKTKAPTKKSSSVKKKESTSKKSTPKTKKVVKKKETVKVEKDIIRKVLPVEENTSKKEDIIREVLPVEESTPKKEDIIRAVLPVEEPKVENKDEIHPYVEIVSEKEASEEVQSTAISTEKGSDTPAQDNNYVIPSIGIILLTILCLMCMVGVGVFAFFYIRATNHTGNFTVVGTYYDRILSEDYYHVFNEETLHSLFPDKEIKGTDFNNYYYVVLPVQFNSCGESNLVPKGYQLENDTLTVTFEYEASCGVCAPQYVYYLLELDKSAVVKDVEFKYHAINDPECDPGIAYKPILYFYPTEKTNITVTLKNDEYLTFTYPKYNDGWKVTAYPDGTLIDSSTGREYYGLFWEGNHHKVTQKEEGFVVKGENTIPFLEEKLKLLGLTDKEANEFIIYWYPKLETNPYNYIYFETKEEINDYMALDIHPTPDSVIRIQMDYKPLSSPIKVKEQKLVTPKRDGFTVVEWGGSIIKD